MHPVMKSNRYHEKDYALARLHAESTTCVAKVQKAADVVRESNRVLHNKINRNSK